MGHRAKSNRPSECAFVGKGGMKLAFALSHFQIEVQDKIVADLGSHQGGFVDCLLAHKAQKVYAVDTCYGTLDWKLRKDPRVVVQERTNAMHWRPPEQVDRITIDVGWTKQEHIIPAAMKMMKKEGTILSLLKAQYEIQDQNRRVLGHEEVKEVVDNLIPFFQERFENVSSVFSPYPGSGGNHEVWFCLSKMK